MCPPAKSPPPPEIDPCCEIGQLILLLDKYTTGSNLPSNVRADLSPYQHPPSSLPEGIWYIVLSGEKKESNHGSWKTILEPCKIYANDSITGWRTTLEYFEGGQRTDWVMQEYNITRKEELCDEDKMKDSRLLCRVYLSSGPHSRKTEDEALEIDLLALINSNINSSSGHGSLNESKCECGIGELPEVEHDKPSYSPQNSNEQNCISAGDFLELNDLKDPMLRVDFLELNDLRDPMLRGDFLELNNHVDHGSESSSSRNSSCTSNLSDEYFDSMAFLLREIEKGEKNYIQQEKQLSCSFTAPVGSDNIILQHAPSGMYDRTRPSDAGRTESNEVPQIGSEIEISIDTAPKRHNSEVAETITSSGEQNADGAGPSGVKKAGVGRLKKLKLYFCFSF